MHGVVVPVLVVVVVVPLTEAPHDVTESPVSKCGKTEHDRAALNREC